MFIALFWCMSVVAQSVSVPAVTAKVVAFTRTGNLFWVVSSLWLLAIPTLFVWFRWSAALSVVCRRLGRGKWFWTIALMAASYTLATGLLLLPLAFARFSWLQGYVPGPKGHTTSQWLVEQLGTLLIEVVVALLVAWLPYWLLARSPGRWWLWSGVMLSPVVLFILVLQPFWISPFTSQYRPLQDTVLLAEMTQMAQRCGVDHAEIFVGGDSYQVAGLGPTKRILLGTRYAEEFSPAQLRFLMGHELGHNVNGDNWKAWGAISMALTAVLWLVNGLGTAAIRRWHPRFGFSALSDPASLPLIVFFLLAFMTLLTPLNMLWSRHIEHEADRFGLELTHENRAAALMFAGFERTYLESPEPGWFALVTRWNHPPGAERIRFANDYHPWVEGKPLVYGNECRMH
jgi:Zn-dependent protease with chaperone function